MNTSKISQRLRFATAFVNQNIIVAKTTNYIDVSSSGRVALVLIGADPENDATMSVQFKSASDASGTGAANLGDPVAVESAGGVPLSVTAERKIEGMPAGHSFVGATVVETGSPSQLTAVSGVFALADNRYMP